MQTPERPHTPFYSRLLSMRGVLALLCFFFDFLVSFSVSGLVR